MEPLKIGNIILPHRAVFGPMAGFTDAPCRRLMAQHGAGFTVSEMVSSRALVYGDHKTVSLLKAEPNGAPYGVQIFGEVPEIMGEAAAAIEAYPFDFLDINMGCPAPKIVGNGDGSALLKDLSQARAALAAVRRATSLPVTVKMRLGWDEEHLVAEELAHICQEEGADAITVHGRTRVQFYSGKADWDAIARVKKSVRIPVFGNGDLNTAEEALARMRESGVDGVSIARGATGNPWIFARFARLKAGLPAPEPGDRERVETAMRHAQMLADWKGEAVAIREMRKHAAWYTRGMYGAAQMRPALYAAETLEELRAAFERVLEKAEER